MKTLKYLFSLLVISVSIFLGVKLAKRKKSRIENLEEQAFDNLDKAGKEKFKATKIIKKLKKNKDKRKKIRDKYSTIVPILIMLFTFSLNAKYLVYDKEDKVTRDYGNVTNYIQSLKNEKFLLIYDLKDSMKAIEHYSNAYCYMSNAYKFAEQRAESLERPWYSSLWESVDFYIGMILGWVGRSNVDRYKEANF